MEDEQIIKHEPQEPQGPHLEQEQEPDASIPWYEPSKTKYPFVLIFVLLIILMDSLYPGRHSLLLPRLILCGIVVVISALDFFYLQHQSNVRMLRIVISFIATGLLLVHIGLQIYDSTDNDTREPDSVK